MLEAARAFYGSSGAKKSCQIMGSRWGKVAPRDGSGDRDTSSDQCYLYFSTICVYIEQSSAFGYILHSCIWVQLFVKFYNLGFTTSSLFQLHSLIRASFSPSFIFYLYLFCIQRSITLRLNNIIHLLFLCLFQASQFLGSLVMSPYSPTSNSL